ncbi:MAG TPA: hypothetical protein VNK04_13690 [Gemmataceae bacterium]|nr:hypothetical protein [Gemmataceae bacterium]
MLSQLKTDPVIEASPNTGAQDDPGLKEDEICLGEATRPEEVILQEVGKALTLDSLVTGREYCRSMIQLSTAAIPVYVALLTFVRPVGYAPSLGERIVAALPALAFLAAAVIFAVGHFPRRNRPSLEPIEETEATISRLLYRRYRFSVVGTAIFCAGMLIGLVVTIVIAGAR